MSARMLSSGREAEIVRDAEGWTLKVGGYAQSHVGDASQPPKLTVMQWMLAAALELLGERDAGAALHIGGGAVTLPRLLQHALPGMRQRVIELEPALVDLVHELAPLPDGVELVVGDGRAALATVETPVSLVVIDVFDGGRVPAPFTSLECFAAARAALEPGGALIINSVDGPPAHFVRAQLATLQAVFSHVAMVTRGSTIAARKSNIVLLASDAPLPIEAIGARVREGPPRAMVVGGRRLERFIADTAPEPVTDATAVDNVETPLTLFAEIGSLPASLTDPVDE